jgi:hypothetical protein
MVLPNFFFGTLWFYQTGWRHRRKRMLGWRKHQIYGIEEKSTQSVNNHPISQDSKENQNYSELERSTHHYELIETEKTL